MNQPAAKPTIPLSEKIAQVESGIREALAAAPPRNAEEVNAVEAAKQRTENLVAGICNETIVSLTKRRDDLDNTIERIRVSQRALATYIGHFAKFNHDVLTMSANIAKEIAEATVPFAANPPATITQLDKKEG